MNKKILFLFLIFFLSIYLRWNNYEGITSADPYYHYRKVDEILKGEISDIDYLRNPPEGLLYKKNFYHYLVAYSYKLVPSMTLEEYMGYVPILLSLLSIFIAYKIGKIFDSCTGIFTAFFTATTPIIVERTGKSFADTDAIILCFVLLLIFLCLKFLITKKIIYLFFLGITLFLFQTTWEGFWLYTYFFIGFFFFYAVHKRNIKIFIIPLMAYLIPALIYDKTTPTLLFQFYEYHSSADIVKAKELDTITLNVIKRLGILLPLGMIGLYLSSEKYKTVFPLLSSFLILSTLTLIGGYRFLFLFAIPLIILASIPFSFLVYKLWGKKKKISVCIIGICLILGIFHIYPNGRLIRGQPSEDLRECLAWMNKNTPEDSIVLAWWDYGYWIEAIAKRPSFTDNGYRPLEKVIWTAEVLTSKDIEKLGEYDIDYILLTERELYDFEIISQHLGKRISFVTKSGVVMINEDKKGMLFTKLFLDNARNIKEVELVKTFGKVKLFKILS